MANEIRIGGARVDYTGKDAGFTRATKKVTRQLTGFEKKAGRAKRAAKGLTATIAASASAHLKLGAAIGAVLGGAGVGQFIKAQGEMATKMESFSKITGLTITELQIFQKAMGEFAIGTNVSNKALQTLAKATGEAKRGLKSYQDAFAAIGVSMDMLEGKNMQEVLNAVSRGLKETEDTATRTASAMLLLGGRGVEVAAALQKVSFENKEYVQSIIDTGILTEKEADNLHKVTAAYDTFGDTLDTLKLKLGAELSPEWAKLVGNLTEVAPIIVDAVTPAFKGLVFVIGSVVSAITGIAQAIDFVVDKTGELLSQSASKNIDDALQRYQRGRAELERAEASGNEFNIRKAQQYVRKQEFDLIKMGHDPFVFSNRNPVYEQALKKFAQAGQMNLAGGAGMTRSGVSNKKYEIEVQVRAQQSARDIMFAQLDMFKRAAGSDVRAASESAAVIKETQDAVSKVWADETERFARAGRVGRFNAANEEVVRQQRMDAVGASELERFMRTGRNEKFSRELAEAEEGIFKLSDAARDKLQPVFTGLDSQLNTLFSNIANGTASASDAFKSLAASITQAVYQALVLQPLVDSITGGIGSFFGFSPQARASGGPVNARSPYIVGEKGPELFVPNHSGSIVPNHRMAGESVVIQQHNEFKLFDDTSFQNRMIPIAAAIKEESMKGTLEALQAPGAMAN